MRYLALGDSISIDDYTGVPGGGAASQFARHMNASEFVDLTADGSTTEDVISALEQVIARPDVITLTVGGNDFLRALWLSDPEEAESVLASAKRAAAETLVRIDTIAGELAKFGCSVIINTVYDPSDGDDSLADSVGLPPDVREGFVDLNEGIRHIAEQLGFILADLTKLFNGHGILSPDPWFIKQIEPNYAGATAIATEWHRLYKARVLKAVEPT